MSNTEHQEKKWMEEFQARQDKLAGNRSEIKRIIESQRQVTSDELKQATLAGILAAENGVPGDEWRARLAESERHQQYVLRRGGGEQPQQEPQQQIMSSTASASARAPSSSSVTFQFPTTTTATTTTSSTNNENTHHQQQQPSTQPQHSVPSVGGAQQQSSSSSSIVPSSRTSSYYPYNSKEEADRRVAEAKALAEREAALRIKLAKDHVGYVEAVHAREDAIREKSQHTRETALLNEVIAARNECRRHVSEAEMSCRNQEDLLRIIAALKKQLSESTRELEYARKEIDFTGRECEVKKSESQDLRVELALLRKANEKLDFKLKKREDLIVQLEREKADVLLDCKKLIRDKQEADDRVTKMTIEFTDQQKQFEEFRREAAVAPHFRAGAPSPMIFEAHRRVSPSHHSRESNTNNIVRSSSSSNRSRSPFIGRTCQTSNNATTKENNINNNNAGSSCSTYNKKDLELLLRDLYADLSSCPLLRRAVCWDSARSGPQVLPIWFDRAMWETVKRKASIQDNPDVPTTNSSTLKQQQQQQSSRKNKIQKEQEERIDNDDDEEDDERELFQNQFPYNSYTEYKNAKKRAQKMNQQQTRMISPLLNANSQTTCRRCGHAHHCHHRCQFCTGDDQNNNNINSMMTLQHDRAERAHITKTKSPLKSVLKKSSHNHHQLPPRTAIVVSSSIAAETSDENRGKNVSSSSAVEIENKNKVFIQNADAAQKRLDKIAAQIDSAGDDTVGLMKRKEKNGDENDHNDDDDEHAVSPLSSSEQQQQQARGASSTSTATSFGVSRPFKQYVASADQLAREARRGNRFVVTEL